MSDLSVPSPLDPVFTVRAGGVEHTLDVYSREGFLALAELWTRAGWQQKISDEVTWLGVPIIQLPEDILMAQELVWKLRPDVVVESGIAHGGASCSMHPSLSCSAAAMSSA